jgi:hypothetical protein
VCSTHKQATSLLISKCELNNTSTTNVSGVCGRLRAALAQKAMTLLNALCRPQPRITLRVRRLERNGDSKPGPFLRDCDQRALFLKSGQVKSRPAHVGNWRGLVQRWLGRRPSALSQNCQTCNRANGGRPSPRTAVPRRARPQSHWMRRLERYSDETAAQRRERTLFQGRIEGIWRMLLTSMVACVLSPGS